jgi:hypothetical protein
MGDLSMGEVEFFLKETSKSRDDSMISQKKRAKKFRLFLVYEN